MASAFTAARFINGEAISGNPLGLRIAAGNAPNLVDPVTGGWGKVLLDPLNSSMTTTLANSGHARLAHHRLRHRGQRRLARPLPQGRDSDRRSDAEEHARSDGRHRPRAVGRPEGTLRACSTKPTRSRRTVPGAQRPSCRISPTSPTTSPSRCASRAAAYYANGRFMFDADGNLWSGMNWMPGSQSGVNKSIGGGVGKFAPNGTALSPPITGFTGMGIDGVGWGTAVTKDRVWITSFNGKILVMDFNGKPVAKESDFPFKEKFLGLMGIGVAANGDVWIADGSDNQLLYFPGGRIKDGRIVKVAGLKSPFDIVIDDQNRVWVANSSSDTVVRFPANDPTKVETFRAGIGVRALALDSKGNVWVASNMDLRHPAAEASRWHLHHGAVQAHYCGTCSSTSWGHRRGPPVRST